MTRAAAIAGLLLAGWLLGGCSGPKPRGEAPPAEESREAASRSAPAGPRRARPDRPGEYTPGGLYKPGVRDSGPAVAPDLSELPEPVPQVEPRARYGNRSPYTVLGRSYHVLPSAQGYVQRGTASWYGEKFHGRATSSLEPYDMYAFSAAHKSLPLPTYARVTNLDTGRSVVVRINDRGPFHQDRLIDLSYAAAVRLGIHARGTGRVEVRALTPGEAPSDTAAVPARAGGDPGRAREPLHGAPREPRAAADARRTWVQVGSFGNKDNAQRLRDQLRDADLAPVSIDRARAGSGRVWRVRLGPVAGRELAEQVATRLQALGFGRPTLVPE